MLASVAPSLSSLDLAQVMIDQPDCLGPPIIPDDIQKKIRGGLHGTELYGKRMGVQVREIGRNKKTIWEWNNWEHFDVEKDTECPLGFRMVYGYANSVDVFRNGDIIISVRHIMKN